MFRQVYAPNVHRRKSITPSDSSSGDDDGRSNDGHFRGQRREPDLKLPNQANLGRVPSYQPPMNAIAVQPAKPYMPLGLQQPPLKGTKPPPIDMLFNKMKTEANETAALPRKDEFGYGPINHLKIPGQDPNQEPPLSPRLPREPKEKHRSHRSHEHGSVLRTAFSAFCLFAGTVAYCILGGLMFSYLEQSNETAECSQLRNLYQKARNATAFTLYDIASSPDMGDEDKMEAFLPILDTMRSSIQNISWDGRNCENMQMKWNLVSASFFSFTIVSTIGYGHIAPKTNWGRLVCIAYATVGLPLMLLTLAKLGAIFAYYFRAFYFKILCCGFCIKRRRAQAKRRQSLAKRQQLQNRFHNDKASNASNLDLLNDSSDEEDESNPDANIPLLLSLGVAALAIVVGVLIYSHLEKWSASDAAYFSFVSLATIGFGDLVPGYSPLTGATDDFKMIVTAGYIFWGMTILSMALQMMQDEVIAKFRWLGSKLRLLCCRKKSIEEASNRRRESFDHRHHQQHDEVAGNRQQMPALGLNLNQPGFNSNFMTKLTSGKK